MAYNHASLGHYSRIYLLHTDFRIWTYILPGGQYYKYCQHCEIFPVVSTYYIAKKFSSCNKLCHVTYNVYIAIKCHNPPCVAYAIRIDTVHFMMTSSNGHIFRVTVLFVRGIYRSPVNSPHKGQWRGALMFSFICAWTNSWASNGEAGDLRRHHAHYDVIVML